MMADISNGGMSSKDFRAHLYHSLQGRGILDSLKSQLRKRLATELHKTEGSVFNSLPSASGDRNKSMSSQVTASIVAEYLKSTGHEYSLSVFLPESGISIDKLFSCEDLLNFLRVPPSSKLYKLLDSQHNNFLEGLLKALSESEIHDVGVPQLSTPSPAAPPQVSLEPPASHQSPPPTKSIADRLEALDQSYAYKAEQESQKSQASLEDRLASFQSDLETRYKRQFEAEMMLYRTRELTKVREEEREKYQRELSKEKDEMHRNYQLRLEETRKSEQRVMERYRMKEQELESGIYSQRQSLLEQLNNLKVKEGEFMRQTELDKRLVALEREKVTAMTEQLENREKQRKAQFDLMVQEKVQKEKMEYELQLQSTQNKLAKWEAQLKAETEGISSLKEENKILREKSEEKFQAELYDSTWKQISLQTQKGDGLRKQDLFDGDLQLRQKVAELQQQLSLSESKYVDLKITFKQQQQNIKQLQTQLSQSSHNQTEMDQLRKAHHKEILVLEYDNKQLRKQLTEQTEHTLLLQRKLDEQLLQLRSAQREFQDIQSLLEHIHPQGLQKNSKKGKLNKRPLPTKPQQYQAQNHSKSFPPHTLPPTSSSRHDLSWTLDMMITPDVKREKNASFFDTSGSFLAESRATIQRMEKEAEELERTYRDFNSQMLSKSLLPHHSLPSHSLSAPSPPSPLLVNPSPISSPLPNFDPLPPTSEPSINSTVVPTLAYQPTTLLSSTKLYPNSSLPPILLPISSIAPTDQTVMGTQNSPPAPVVFQPPKSLHGGASPIVSPQAGGPVQQAANPQASSILFHPPTSAVGLIAFPQSGCPAANPQASSTIPPDPALFQLPTSVAGPIAFPQAGGPASSQQVTETPASTVSYTMPVTTTTAGAIMSLDSWWQQTSEPPKSETTSVRAIQTPATSTVSGSGNKQLDEVKLLERTMQNSVHQVRTGGEGLSVEQPLVEQPHFSRGLFMERPELLVEQPSDELPAKSPATQAPRSRSTSGGSVKDSEDDGIDPVMLKYMKLVKERKQSTQKTQYDNELLDVAHLSQGSDSIGGDPSHHDNDPFEDW